MFTVLFVLACSGALLLLQSCAAPHEKLVSPRSARYLSSLAVEISAKCIDEKGEERVAWGSGVLISNRYIITAAHVVNDCEQPNVMIRTQDMKVYPVEVAYLSGDDTAYLRLGEGLTLAHKFTPPKFGEIGEGDQLCFSAGVPDRSISCGEVTDVTERLPPGNIQHTAHTIPGNSGSGVFNDKNELVGIVTHTRWDKGGLATSLWQHQRFLKKLLALNP